MLESSKLASGRNESWRSLDYVEINGSEGSFVFRTGEWDRLQVGRVGGPGLETRLVPEDFWKLPGSPRDPKQGDPLVTFRYDQMWEFVDAIRNQRFYIFPHPEWKERIEHIRAHAAAVFVVTANSAAGKSVVNALQLTGLLSETPSPERAAA